MKAPLGNASAGTYVYKIDKRSVGGLLYYRFSINGADQFHLDASKPDHCWGDGGDIGPTGAEFQNEMLNVNDYNNGTTAVHQSFSGIQYQSAIGWHNVSWTLRSPVRRSLG